MKVFVIARVARMWQNVYANSDTVARIDLLLVDADGSAMQAVIPNGILRWFFERISEGGVYKILRFDTVECKLYFVVIPSTYIIYFSTTTHVEEVLESVHMYSRYFFRFASFEEICLRGDKEPVLTDVIGVLTHVGEKSTVERSSGHGKVDKIDIIFKL
ncbi:Nucleic acid-binding protein [Corchorus capsularis]|uniref:Nucleic acid-binding protein n=1 Tax=Corchorus capsularis TaxID=210143 RepID=A0A1R3FZ18_COCAP|nr:Nucleic acid-binding protein [Corchorus capsularis]